MYIYIYIYIYLYIYIYIYLCVDVQCDAYSWMRSVIHSSGSEVWRSPVRFAYTGLGNNIFWNIFATSKIGTLVLHANRHPPRVYIHQHQLSSSWSQAGPPCIVGCRICLTLRGIGTFWRLHRNWRSHVHDLRRDAPDSYSSRGGTFPGSDIAHVSACQIAMAAMAALSPQCLPQMAEVMHAKLGLCV